VLQQKYSADFRLTVRFADDFLKTEARATFWFLKAPEQN
jgi:hypothetical protein